MTFRTRALAVVRTSLATLMSVAFTLALLEGAAQVVWRVREGHWLYQRPDPSWRPAMFRAHPYLVGVPRAGARTTRGGISISHNAQGWRGANIGPKAPGVVRVLAIGGSSTYGVRIPDGSTWPELLAAELGAGYDVVNMGVPGYTTVENLIQAAFWASDLSPDLMVFYEGWNDAHTSYVQGLAPDYSDYHAAQQHIVMGRDVWRRWNRVATLRYADQLVSRVLPFDPPRPPTPVGAAGKLTATADPRALALYRRNLGLLAAVTREIGAEPLFVPQVMNVERLTATKPYGWLPFVRDVDLPAIMAQYNEAMRAVASAKGVAFVGDALTAGIGPDDFIDQGHLTVSGGRKLVGPLAVAIRRAAQARRATR